MDEDEVCFECRREYFGQEPPCGTCNLKEDDEEDEIDNSFIHIVSRNHKIFTNRHTTFTTVQKGKLVITELPSIPDNVIVCDGCNNLIEDDEVGLLMLDKERCWGTQCKSCIKEYFSELPVVRE